MYQPYPPTTISPGPPLFPLNPRECGSLDLAPFLTVSCLTAIWRPSFRYWPICALCLSMSSAVSLAVLGGFSCLLPTSFLPKRWLTHALTFPLAHCLVFTVFAIQERQGEGEKTQSNMFWRWFDFISSTLVQGVIFNVSFFCEPPQPSGAELIWLCECQLAANQPCSTMQINTWSHPPL